MKFSLVVKKWANFYFFIQNLSEWHKNNRRDYNIFWEKEIGPFSQGEKNALKQFKKIRSKYKPKSHFEQSFYIAKNPWKEFKKSSLVEEYRIIKKIFSLLWPKFNNLYKKDLPLLRKWQKILNKQINNPATIKIISRTLKILYNAQLTQHNVNIFLLLSTPNCTGGSANIDSQSIGIEISRYPLQGANQAIGIIWHELIHLYFEKKYFIPLLLRHFEKDNPSIGLILEITASSLFPNGALGQDILQIPKSKFLNVKIPPQFNKTILNFTKKYIENEKKFDNNYIKKLLPIAQSLKK